MSGQDWGLLIGVWLGYALLHSLFASLWLKQRVAQHLPGFMPLYRLTFNLLAVLLLALPLYLSLIPPSDVLWQWTGPWRWLSWGLSALAFAGFLYSLRYYDMHEFIGLRQWFERERRVEEQEHLRISPLHRHVRHPWYSFALVLVWTRDMDERFLVAAVAISAYFVLGSRLEERKLLRYYGDAYAEYRARVPAILPLPWRSLDASQAADLEASAAN